MKINGKNMSLAKHIDPNADIRAQLNAPTKKAEPESKSVVKFQAEPTTNSRLDSKGKWAYDKPGLNDLDENKSHMRLVEIGTVMLLLSAVVIAAFLLQA